MRAAAHAAISGASAFAMVSLIRHQNPAARLPHPGFAALVAAVASGLPDVLEPATSPHHRQFCHSAAAVVLVIAGLKRLYEWQCATPVEVLMRDALLSLAIGYLAHLGADATTAMGLPIIGKIG